MGKSVLLRVLGFRVLGLIGHFFGGAFEIESGVNRLRFFGGCCRGLDDLQEVCQQNLSQFPAVPSHM